MDTPQKIRLLIFVPSLECGGTERYVSLLCNHIDINRFDVTLAVLNDAHPFYEIRHTIEVIDLKTKRVRNALFRIKKLIKQNKPDIIYSNANHLNLLFALARWMFPKNILIIARESSVVSINSKRASYPKLYLSLIKKYYRRLDHIICQSAYMRQDLVSNFNVAPESITVIHNPVAEISGSTVNKNASIKKFITVARLSNEKGIDRLIRSVALLDIPFEYYVVGEGNERTALEKLINELQLQDKVFLTGEKIDPYQDMNDADLMLCGSHYEGFPNALLEAGMLGIPVVAFNAPGGIGEIIKDGENGLLVTSNAEKDLSNAIKRALDMNFDRQQIIDTTRQKYSPRIIVPKTMLIFENLLSEQ